MVGATQEENRVSGSRDIALREDLKRAGSEGIRRRGRPTPTPPPIEYRRPSRCGHPAIAARRWRVVSWSHTLARAGRLSEASG